jgi:hypothetical protein
MGQNHFFPSETCFAKNLTNWFGKFDQFGLLGWVSTGQVGNFDYSLRK